jgi:hypothetical protein
MKFISDFMKSCELLQMLKGIHTSCSPHEVTFLLEEMATNEQTARTALFHIRGNYGL